jgi:hypothetical protein
MVVFRLVGATRLGRQVSRLIWAGRPYNCNKKTRRTCAVFEKNTGD